MGLEGDESGISASSGSLFTTSRRARWDRFVERGMVAFGSREND